MQTLPKLLESKTKIRFQDCDPFNHLNNGNYIDYFMNHREDELANIYDLDIYKLTKNTKKSWVSSANQIVYLKPANLMETVTIQSQLIGFTNSSLKAEMRMYNEEKTELKSIIWCSFVYIDLITKKRTEHSNILLDLFENVINPVGTDLFEERIKMIRAKKVLS